MKNLSLQRQFPQGQSVQKQSGLALITVLLVFAIVAILATAMIERQSLDLQRSTNMLILQQSRAYTHSAESAMRTALFLDWENKPETDTLNPKNDFWVEDRTFPLEPGTAEMRVLDAQGRFNINSLHPTAANKDRQKKRFENLLNLLSLNVQLANTLSAWLDENSQDDNRYLALERPYRAAYRQCKHPSELLLLEELDQQTFNKLEPYISCLPIATPLNINTADATVLASLDADFSLSDANSLIANRGEEGFADVDAFWNDPLLEKFTKPQNNGNQNNDGQNGTPTTSTLWEKGDFSVYSEYFEAFTKVTLSGRIATSEALIYRNHDDGRLTTVYRDFSRRRAKDRPADLSNNNNGQLPGNALPGSGAIGSGTPLL